MDIIIQTILVIAICSAGFGTLAWLLERLPYAPRPKLPDYIGRFKRPQGDEVHVARVNGELMVIKDTKPGELPLDLGNISGRELATWQKQSTTPDGKDCIARSD